MSLSNPFPFRLLPCSIVRMTSEKIHKTRGLGKIGIFRDRAGRFFNLDPGITKYGEFLPAITTNESARYIMKSSLVMAVKRGAFFVVEGVDRSGKSTQCKKLVETLKSKNINVQGANFPDRKTAIGQLIDEYLKNQTQLSDEAIHLLFTANRWEKMQEIKKSLEAGVTWIVDRYSYSGIVFSSVKKNMSLDWCKMPESGLPKPDLTFLLMVDDETLTNRPGFGNEIYEKSDIQIKVKNLFKNLCNEQENWKIVDANCNIEEVHDAMLKDVLQKIEEVKNKPLEYFNFLPKKNCDKIENIV